MTLTSLRSAAGFANSALDTARSTWKGLAEAAVNPEPVAEVAAPALVVAEEPEAPVAPAGRKGLRLGTLLDAYA